MKTGACGSICLRELILQQACDGTGKDFKAVVCGNSFSPMQEKIGNIAAVASFPLSSISLSTLKDVDSERKSHWRGQCLKGLP